MIQYLEGKPLAEKIRDKVKNMVSELPQVPGMAAILVGDDPASHLYVSLKEKACKDVGIYFEKHLFSPEIPTEQLVAFVEELNQRKNIHGILVQLPLPNQDTNKVIAAINPNKDIDGFHPLSLKRLENHEPGLVSPVALGVMKLVDEAKKQNAIIQTAVLVCSEIFGQPLLSLLQEQSIKSAIISWRDLSFSEKTKEADLIIVAVGKPGIITDSMIKKDATIIDVGTTKVNNKVMGDADISVQSVAGFLTPVPGGVGPLTVAMLTLNVVKAFRFQEN